MYSTAIYSPLNLADFADMGFSLTFPSKVSLDSVTVSLFVKIKLAKLRCDSTVKLWSKKAAKIMVTAFVISWEK